MSAPRQELAEVGRRLSSQGFDVKPVRYFSDDGIVVFVPPAAPDFGDLPPVIERGVNLYPSEDGWEARMTVHGGPHWVRQAEDIAALEAIALEALRAICVPPTDAWIRSGAWSSGREE